MKESHWVIGGTNSPLPLSIQREKSVSHSRIEAQGIFAGESTCIGDIQCELDKNLQANTPQLA